jgi:hypothetical protein
MIGLEGFLRRLAACSKSVLTAAKFAVKADARGIPMKHDGHQQIRVITTNPFE